ncbi:acyl-CoA dehydrogenase family protein [Noviherbaspirillum saxi]|uniref:Acyl-CoA dehydrogenase n=1 Tax=Noviherbaspirillum saxi TaxID=2320863 RepID=A0A3A3FEM1_9BURK|nr:acyl-CoA dehydrogenase family protein [Noviherbaspirillum saxi]RJF91690.1 acyl-CoA dehydrogenase [Noviherbaspirillum saxi]
MWDFSTDPEFQSKLDWMKEFVRKECEPLDMLFPHAGDCYDIGNKKARAIARPLMEEVKRQGLWACHLGPELGGQGYGQVKLALMNEILGRSLWAPTIFGTAAPDTGNAEILAMFGTEEQKQRYLQPLLDGDIVSCYSMTEPQGGADPGVFECTAVREGNEWVINGEKWFSSNARYAEVLIVMCVTNPDVPIYKGASMFLVPADTPGVNILRNTGVHGEPVGEGAHAYIRYENVRVPADALLGEEGQGFAVAQARLGGGRVHHAMRTVGQCQLAIEMMTERAVSRSTKGSLLGDKQAVQGYIADSWIELQQFRLQVLHTAWLIDQGHEYKANQLYIAGIKVASAKVFHDIVQRAIHMHGALGVSDEMPLGHMWIYAAMMGIMDGPTEVHKGTVAKNLLKQARPAEGMFPSAHLLTRREAARRKYEGMY